MNVRMRAVWRDGIIKFNSDNKTSVIPICSVQDLASVKDDKGLLFQEDETTVRSNGKPGVWRDSGRGRMSVYFYSTARSRDGRCGPSIKWILLRSNTVQLCFRWRSWIAASRDISLGSFSQEQPTLIAYDLSPPFCRRPVYTTCRTWECLSTIPRSICPTQCKLNYGYFLVSISRLNVPILLFKAFVCYSSLLPRTPPHNMQHPTLHNVRIRSTRDALQVFHGVATHRLPLITRRLDAEERRNIMPGNVYVW